MVVECERHARGYLRLRNVPRAHGVCTYARICRKRIGPQVVVNELIYMSFAPCSKHTRGRQSNGRCNKQRFSVQKLWSGLWASCGSGSGVSWADSSAFEHKAHVAPGLPEPENTDSLHGHGGEGLSSVVVSSLVSGSRSAAPASSSRPACMISHIITTWQCTMQAITNQRCREGSTNRHERIPDTASQFSKVLFTENVPGQLRRHEPN